MNTNAPAVSQDGRGCFYPSKRLYAFATSLDKYYNIITLRRMLLAFFSGVKMADYAGRIGER